MIKDTRRPEGLYGDVYDKSTGAKSRAVTKRYIGGQWWDYEIARIATEELLKHINEKLGVCKK